jgi:outer membrane lipoprotein-sorting protein
MQPLFASLLLTFTQPQDAEQWYRAMEKQITTARSLKMACKTSVDTGKNAHRVDVKLWAATGNRLRVEGVAAFKPNKGDDILVVSNGKKTVVYLSAKTSAEERDTDLSGNQKIFDLLARSAVGTALDELVRPGKQPPPGDISLSRFKLGPKERADGKREVQVVDYEVVLKEKADSHKIKVKVWIDTETLLPVRRVLMITVGSSDTQYTEVFTEFTLDPMIDAKMFDLPK